MRYVRFSDKQTNEDGVLTEWTDALGLFHQWGLDGLESGDGNMTWTVAIVEDSMGTVHVLDPKKIKFVKPEEVETNASEIFKANQDRVNRMLNFIKEEGKKNPKTITYDDIPF